jgi:hypothetical protein
MCVPLTQFSIDGPGFEGIGRFGPGDRMKKPADKMTLRELPGVCRLIREKGDNQSYGLHRTTNTAAHTEGDLPHPSPLFAPCI